MRILKGIIGSLLLIGLLAGCKKDDETGSYKLDLRAKSTKAASWNLTSATAILTELELESDDDDDDNNEIDLEGRYEVDLLTGTSSPALPEIEVAAGTYQELEIELGDDDDGEEALFVTAEYDLNGVVMTVNIVVEGELEWEVEDDDGIEISAGSHRNLTVFIGIENALNSMDMSQAQLTGSNEVNINPNSNSGLYAAFVAGLNFELDD